MTLQVHNQSLKSNALGVFLLSVSKQSCGNVCILRVPRYTHSYTLFPYLKGVCNSREGCIFLKRSFQVVREKRLLLYDKEVSE